MFTFPQILTLIIVAGAFITLFFLLKRIEDKTKHTLEVLDWVKELNRRVDVSSQAVDQRLGESMRVFNARLDNSTLVISQLQKNVGEFSEIGRSMKDLQQLLQSPKLRGNLGEHILNDLLAQYFPLDTFALQYSFKNGEKADAIIKTAQGIIPIDAKFPLENFRKMYDTTSEVSKKDSQKAFERDVKKHIGDIERKYIREMEGTVGYALMYVPSEAVYYEIINNPDIFDFASAKRILPVSPMSFYAYMKAILMSFEGQKIEQQAKEILIMLNSIKQDYEKVDESLGVLNRHITNAYNQTANVSRIFLGLGQKLKSTVSLQKQETKQIEQTTIM